MRSALKCDAGWFPSAATRCAVSRSRRSSSPRNPIFILHLLAAATLDPDQPRTTDLFFRMTRDGHSAGDALSVVTAAEAPFVQVPSHINVRDGQITLINNDHTILGLRASAYLMPYLPEKYRLLPLLQSVWYIPAGLDIWNQLLGK